MSTAAAPGLYYDPYDFRIDEDPYPVWRRLRDEAPVYFNERLEFYAVSRYDDVAAASLDTAHYSSAFGNVLEMIKAAQEGGPRYEWLISLDPPKHTAMRKLAARGFTPRRMAALEPFVRSVVREQLDRFVGSGGFDYVADFAAGLPPAVISTLLGVPEQDHSLLRAWADDMHHLDEGATAMGGDAGQVAMARFHDYFAQLAAARRNNPREDLVSALVESDLSLPDGTTRALTDDEVVDYVILIAGAGTETVARFLGNAIVALDRFPDERRRLVEAPEMMPNAVEELLRYEAPSPLQGRLVAHDVTVRGVRLPAGARVALLTGSAGRDERHFTDPDRLDVGREMVNHLGLGWGIHFCLGAALARTEARIALEETLARFPTWSVDPAGTRRSYSSTVRGYSNVPIQL